MVLFHGQGVPGSASVCAGALHWGKGRSPHSMSTASASVSAGSPAAIGLLGLMERVLKPPPTGPTPGRVKHPLPGAKSAVAVGGCLTARPGPCPGTGMDATSFCLQPASPVSPCHPWLRPRQQLPPAQPSKAQPQLCAEGASSPRPSDLAPSHQQLSSPCWASAVEPRAGTAFPTR